MLAEATRPHRARPSDWFSYLSWGALGVAVGVCPGFLARGIGMALGAASFRLNRRRRLTALANLNAAFAGASQLDDRQEIARVSFLHQGRALVETLRLPLLSPRNFLDYATPAAMRPFYEARDRKAGVILVYQRYGYWASMLATLALMTLPLTVVPPPMRNPLISRGLGRLLARSGARLAAEPDSPAALRSVLEGGGVLALPLAYGATDPEGSAAVHLFGQLSSLSTLPARLALQTGASIVVGHGQPLGRSKFLARFDPPIRVDRDDLPNQAPAFITEQVHERLARPIGQHPAYWDWTQTNPWLDDEILRNE